MRRNEKKQNKTETKTRSVRAIKKREKRSTFSHAAERNTHFYHHHPWPGVYSTLFAYILKYFIVFAFNILHLKFYLFILCKVA